MEIKTVTVMDMADARDRRSENQRRMTARFHRPLISFTLNIPGPGKVFPGIGGAYFSGCRRIRDAMAARRLPILGQLETLSFTGCEIIYSVDGAAAEIKRLAVEIEDLSPIGRLYDIDVIGADGIALSRTDLGLPARRCLLCPRPARECGRSRSHTVDELLSRIREILEENAYPASDSDAAMESLALHCLLGEVEATPKPGLVDLSDSGAHKDMDYGTFASSAYAIAPYLAAMYREGGSHRGDFPSLFPRLRAIGKDAESAMFAATGGVNTHKGAIFSMGILMAACGLCKSRGLPFHAETILDLAAKIAGPSAREDLDNIKKRPPQTHGELLYAQYGAAGIRGEVLNGFPSIRSLALPALRRAAGENHLSSFWAGDAGDGRRLEDNRSFQDICSRKNKCLLDTLLTLMSVVQDTNILIRSDMETLSFVHQEARDFLGRGGAFAPDGIRRLETMNETFIHKNISPGGCADLLAITLFLYELENAKYI